MCGLRIHTLLTLFFVLIQRTRQLGLEPDRKKECICSRCWYRPVCHTDNNPNVIARQRYVRPRLIFCTSVGTMSTLEEMEIRFCEKGGGLDSTIKAGTTPPVAGSKDRWRTTTVNGEKRKTFVKGPIFKKKSTAKRQK